MLGNLKKKLSNALQEGIIISENLQHQYRQRVSTPSTPGTPTLENESTSSRSSLFHSINEIGSTTDLNMAAGCNMLSKYEDDWKKIHAANEENAQKAKQVAAQIESIENHTSTQRVVMKDLVSCLAGMPALVTKLQASMLALQELTELGNAAEQQIEQLENLCEECELQEFMLSKQCELSLFKQKKMSELETYRQKVAAQHQDKIHQHEQRLRQIQRERQAVFDDAFRDDLAEFKQNGMLPKINKEPSQQLALEEVDLADTHTQDALEDFLNG